MRSAIGYAMSNLSQSANWASGSMTGLYPVKQAFEAATGVPPL